MAKKDIKLAKNDKKASGESEIARKFKQNPILYIGSVVILILVIVTFLGSDLISPRTRAWDATFGYYDKVPIRWAPDNVFDQYRRNAVNYYQSQGVDLSNQWMMAQIWQQAFEGAVVHNALLQVMKRSNYEIPAKTVDRKVAQLPELQENGKFSPVIYNRMSEADKLSLWRQTQEDLIKTVYFSDFFDGLLLTNAEAEFIGNMAKTQRSFDLVSVNIDDYPESEFLAYAETNSRLFGSIHLSKITITSGERDAKRILDTINSGTISFEEAARTQSQDGLADRGGDMGARFIYELEREISSQENRDIVFNLRKGEISSVLTMTDAVATNWVIFRAEDEIQKADFSDEATMDRVRTYLRSNDRGKMEDWAIEVAKEFANDVNSAGSFETAARARSLDVQNFGPLPINYSGVELLPGIQAQPIPGYSEQEIGDLSRNENFWKTAFSTPVSSPSEPLVQGNRVLVFYPTEEIESEDAAANAASTYLSYWLYSITEQSIQHYFLNNPRMDNRFMDTYFREMM